MEHFTVQPAALTRFATLLSGSTRDNDLYAQYAGYAEPYADKWVHLDDDAGGMIFTNIAAKTEEVHEDLKDSVHIKYRLYWSAVGLTESAARYREQERSAANRADRVYDPGADVDLDPGVDHTGAPQVTNLASLLTEPGTDAAIPDKAKFIIDNAGFGLDKIIAPLIDLACKALGKDPIEEWVGKKFAGDFEAIARVKNALDALAEFDEAAATTIANGVQTVRQSWQGNAAEAAESYFNRMANAIDGRAVEIRDVARRYNEVLIAVQQAADALGQQGKAVVSHAVETATKLGLKGPCVKRLIKKLPGMNALSAILGAEAAKRLIEELKKFFEIWQAFWEKGGPIANAIVALCAGLAGGLANYDISTKMPQLDYHNESQGPPPKRPQPQPHPVPGGGAYEP